MVRSIKERATELFNVSDARLAELTTHQKRRIEFGDAWQRADIIQEVFALVYEATRRKLQMCFYDVQLLAGIVLATGAIAEMKTGEGKTLVTAFPAALGALTPAGVHVATVNSYLAARDYATLLPVYTTLGLTAGLLRDNDTPIQKKAAYEADITYGTGYEFGFDYLRDQLALQSDLKLPLGQRFRQQLLGIPLRSTQTVQSDLNFAIIDEVDSVLIDEANTPLVISGPNKTQLSDSTVFLAAKELAASLQVDIDFEWDTRSKKIELTDAGVDKIFKCLPPKLSRPWAVYVEQALRAQHLMRRDIDYVVVDDKIKIVDQYTGRIFEERTWRDGLHQAVEAKEGATITDENRSLARISRQRFYQNYQSLCGMTGTALGHETEFQQFYGLSVVDVPLRKPCLRTQGKPRFFANSAAKLDAVARRIAELHADRSPVLVGTRTIEASHSLSRRLRAMNIAHQVLNGVQDEDEANIVAQAGIAGTVTIATNMAGRGTDIKIDQASLERGGLHVISLEFHDSLRIDRQLEGRAARQGDPGHSEFFAAADDELFSQHAPRLAEAIVSSSDAEGEAQKDFSHVVRQLQEKTERRSFLLRCQVYRQQQWLDKVLTTIAEPSLPNKNNIQKGEAA